MKKIFSLLILCGLALSYSPPATSQITEKISVATTVHAGGISATLYHVDTANYVVEEKSDLVSLTVYDFKTSGTVGGKWYLLGYVKGSAYADKLDSLTRADGDDHKTFTLPIKSLRGYSSYKLQGIQTGSTALSTFEIWRVRRN
ncbi:MAG: hypothetical protein JO301_16930 [Chitinophagaceae bacterium]|nr:hypothetical protein [Chitinophagaceae bacterium]